MKAEKRQYPRVTYALPLKVGANGYDFSTFTQNISCVGAYCHIDKYVPPFTKVMVKLALPQAAASGNKSYNMECKGVVVRTEDELNGGFNIAIFFNAITDDQRKKIAHYLEQFLPEKACVR